MLGIIRSIVLFKSCAITPSRTSLKVVGGSDQPLDNRCVCRWGTAEGRGGINDVYFTPQVGNPFKFLGVLKVTDNSAFVR